jgi:hypothetical protein
MSFSSTSWYSKGKKCSCGGNLVEIDPYSDYMMGEPDGVEVFRCSKCGVETKG